MIYLLLILLIIYTSSIRSKINTHSILSSSSDSNSHHYDLKVHDKYKLSNVKKEQSVTTLVSIIKSDSDYKQPPAKLPKSFLLQHPLNGLYVSTCKNRLCLKGEPIVFTYTNNKYVDDFKSEGYGTMSIINTDLYLARKSDQDRTLHLTELQGFNELFAWLPEPSCLGASVTFRNINDDGLTLGYDYHNDTVVLVEFTDNRIVNWDAVNTEDPDDLVVLGIPDFFHLNHPVFDLPMGLCSNNKICLEGEPLVFAWDWPSNTEKYWGFGFNALRIIGHDVNNQPQYLTLSGSISTMSAIKEKEDPSTMLFLPEGSCWGLKDFGTYLHNPRENFRDVLGYDFSSDYIIAVPQGDSRAVDWDFSEIDDKILSHDVKDAIKNIKESKVLEKAESKKIANKVDLVAGTIKQQSTVGRKIKRSLSWNNFFPEFSSGSSTTKTTRRHNHH